MKEYWDRNFLTFDLGDQHNQAPLLEKKSTDASHTIQGEMPEQSFVTGYHASSYHHSSFSIHKHFFQIIPQTEWVSLK